MRAGDRASTKSDRKVRRGDRSSDEGRVDEP